MIADALCNLHLLIGKIKRRVDVVGIVRLTQSSGQPVTFLICGGMLQFFFQTCNLILPHICILAGLCQCHIERIKQSTDILCTSRKNRSKHQHQQQKADPTFI